MTRWTIAKFEFLRFFKWKQELIGLGVMLLFMLLGSSWPLLKNAIDNDYRVAVLATGAMPTMAGYQFTQLTPTDSDKVKQGLGEIWDLVVEVDGHQLLLTAEQNASWIEAVQPTLQQWLQKQAIHALPLTKAQRQVVQTLPTVELHYTKQQAADNDRQFRKGINIALLSLLMVGFFAGFGFMFTAITTEKQQRVTEQLLTMITARQWMDGKIIGISLYALKSMLTYALLALLALQIVFWLHGKSWVHLPLSPLEWLLTISYVLLGLLLLNSFLAGFAATIDDPNHSGRSAIMLLPALPLGLVFTAINNVEGSMMQVLSWLPVTSFAAMPVRLTSSEVAWWELLGSLSLLMLFMYWLRGAAARLFALGIQMYGKEPTWRDIRQAIFRTGAA